MDRQYNGFVDITVSNYSELYDENYNKLSVGAFRLDSEYQEQFDKEKIDKNNDLI
jgi:hypothetical protein